MAAGAGDGSGSTDRTGSASPLTESWNGPEQRVHFSRNRPGLTLLSLIAWPQWGQVIAMPCLGVCLGPRSNLPCRIAACKRPESGFEGSSCRAGVSFAAARESACHLATARVLIRGSDFVRHHGSADARLVSDLTAPDPAALARRTGVLPAERAGTVRRVHGRAGARRPH